MDIREAVKEKILVLDGAMGTWIQEKNLSEEFYRKEMFKNHPVALKGLNEVLNLTSPELVKDVYTSYIQAGANIITTNSFNANYYSLYEYHLEQYNYEINKNA